MVDRPYVLNAATGSKRIWVSNPFVLCVYIYIHVYQWLDLWGLLTEPFETMVTRCRGMIVIARDDDKGWRYTG